jgi:FMN phosphatase YigB (HAD superfamily)
MTFGLGRSPHEVVFLDDDEGQVEAARTCGWHAVLHRETEVSIRELTRTIAQA